MVDRNAFLVLLVEHGKACGILIGVGLGITLIIIDNVLSRSDTIQSIHKET